MKARQSQSAATDRAAPLFTSTPKQKGAASSAVAAAALLARECKASTLRVYEGHMAAWWRWCDERGLHPWPATPRDLAEYTTEIAALGLSPISIQQRVRSIIGLAHERAGLPNPARTAEVRSALVRAVAGNGRRAVDPRLHGKTADFEERLASLPEGPNRERDVALLSLLRETRIESAALGNLLWKDISTHADGSGGLELRYLRDHTELSGRTMRRLAATRNGADDNSPLFVNRQHKPLSAIAVGRALRTLTQATTPGGQAAPGPPTPRASQIRRRAARRLLRRRVEVDGWTTSKLATALGVRTILVRRWLKGSSTPPAYIGLALVAIAGNRPATPPVPVTTTQLYHWVSSRRWTLASTAHALGVSPSAVSMWMHGKVRIPRSLRLALDTVGRRIERWS